MYTVMHSTAATYQHDPPQNLGYTYLQLSESHFVLLVRLHLQLHCPIELSSDSESEGRGEVCQSHSIIDVSDAYSGLESKTVHCILT